MMVTDLGIITSDDEGYLKHYSSSFELLKDYGQIYPKGVVSMAYDDNKQHLYTINRDGILKIFDLQKKEEILEKNLTQSNNSKSYCIRLCKKLGGNYSLFRSDDKGC